MLPTMLSPEELLSLPSDGYFALGLDHTGLNEVDLPRDLRAHFPDWRPSAFRTSDQMRPFDLVADVSMQVVLNGFLTAVQHGSSGCVAQLIDGQEVFLTFWDRLAEAGVVVVIVSSLGRTDAVGVRSLTGDTGARPLRCVIQINRVGIISHIDDAASQILGWRSSVLGSSALTHLHPEDASSTGYATWADLLLHPGKHYGMRWRFRTATGSFKWFDVRAINQLELDGSVEMEMIDVDDYMHERPPPMIPVAVGDRLADLIQHGTVVVDESLCVLAFNEAFCELTGAVVSPATRRLMIGGSAASKEFATLIASHLRRLQQRPTTAIKDWVGEIKVESELVPTGEDEKWLALITVRRSAADLMPPIKMAPGLTEPTMRAILGVLAKAESPRGLTYQEITDTCDVSEVTARRYLAHLQTTGVVDFSLDYGSAGRPRRRFRLVDVDQ